MKVYYREPKKDVIIVKPDREREEYEFWVLTPTLAGRANKAGTQRIVCEGFQFTNLSSAAQHCLDKIGESALAKQQKSRQYLNKNTAKVEVSGLDLMVGGVWGTFCKVRKLNIKDISLLEKTFYLTADEVKKLGLKESVE